MSRKRKVETITKVVSNQECANHRQALSQMKRIKWDFNPKTRKQSRDSTGEVSVGKLNLNTMI